MLSEHFLAGIKAFERGVNILHSSGFFNLSEIEKQYFHGYFYAKGRKSYLDGRKIHNLEIQAKSEIGKVEKTEES